MNTLSKVLLFILLPIVAVLSYPPSMLGSGIVLILIVAVLIGLLGWLLWRGRSLALTFAIFLQGMNVIVRLMMLFSNSMDKTTGVVNVTYIIASLFGLLLSMYLVLKLDTPQVRKIMVR